MTKKTRKALPWIVVCGWIVIGSCLAIIAVAGCTSVQDASYEEDCEDLSGC